MNQQSYIFLFLISILLSTGSYLTLQKPNSELKFLQQDQNLNNGQEINISYKTKEGYQVNLTGRLVIPPNALFILAKQHLAIIVPDADQTDLNCNNPQNLSILNTNSYLQLAQQFEIQGIATFRYNKRNVFPSSTNQPESELSFDDLVEDLNQIIQHLIDLNQFKEFYILGHGEGSGVAMQTITKYLQNNVIQGFVSLNGPGQNGKLILQNNLQQNLPFELHDSLNQFLNQVQQGTATECPLDLEEYNFCNQETGILRQSNLNYLNSYFQFYPTKTFAKMTFIENFIVQGERDLQVLPINAQLLQSANESTANNTYFFKMNHILKDSQEDRSENLSTFTNPELPLTSSLSEILGKFILGNPSV